MRRRRAPVRSLTHACWAVRLASERNRPVENSLLTKHVVAVSKLARDAGSTPAASTIFIGVFEGS